MGGRRGYIPGKKMLGTLRCMGENRGRTRAPQDGRQHGGHRGKDFVRLKVGRKGSERAANTKLGLRKRLSRGGSARDTKEVVGAKGAYPAPGGEPTHKETPAGKKSRHKRKPFNKTCGKVDLKKNGHAKKENEGDNVRGKKRHR